MTHASWVQQMRWSALTIVSLQGSAVVDGYGSVDFGHRHAPHTGPCWEDILSPTAHQHNTMLMTVTGTDVNAMLRNSTACHRAAAALANAVAFTEINGITIDFENGRSTSRDPFTKFVQLVKAALGPTKLVTTVTSAFEKKCFGAMYDSGCHGALTKVTHAALVALEVALKRHDKQQSSAVTASRAAQHGSRAARWDNHAATPRWCQY